MSDRRILIFAGTTEGRRLTEYMAGCGVSVHACTATQYGESMLPFRENVTVSHERMGYEEMCGLIRSFSPSYVIDATHPYAREVTENVRNACRSCSVSCLRLVRERGERGSGIICAEDTEEAVCLLEKTAGNILVTTGSKELEKYTYLTDYRERLYVRVLPSSESVAKCEGLGIKGRHLICMQGPFSAEMNAAVIREFSISCMVTKESGAAGGYPQKYEAARAAGIRMIVIGRPDEEGYTYKEAVAFLEKALKLCGGRKQKVALAGIGPGSSDTFTEHAREVFCRADLIIGAKRMVEAAREKGQAGYEAYKPEEILAYIREHPEYARVAVAFSGDTGFYSGAGKLSALLEKEKDMEAEMIPGISSVSYFCARLGVSWEDAALCSMHGREASPLSFIREHEKTVVLAGSAGDVRRLCRSMTETGLGEEPVCIGINLSYDNEQILRGRAKEYTDYQGGALAVLYIYNSSGGNPPAVQGIPDDRFVRGNVPMTKEEIRCISLSKLRIRKDSVIYDIGAGTGSVAAEAAVRASGGHVYAIERNVEAVRLIRENGRRMRADNITVIEGRAPAALEALPAPDCVFVGGSGGALREILDTVIRKNPRVRIVINAIALETLSEAAGYCKEIKKTEEEITQITVAKARKAGNYSMMTGQNPVYIISFTCGEEKDEKGDEPV